MDPPDPEHCCFVNQILNIGIAKHELNRMQLAVARKSCLPHANTATDYNSLT
jgi:hypothetical protein